MTAKPNTKPLKLNLFQILVLILIGANIVALIVSTKITSDGASKDNQVFSSIEVMARSFSLLQRETLVYTTKFAQWGAGDIPRREVEIARSLLEKRLVRIEGNDVITDQFPELTFFEVLKNSDYLVVTAKPGVLTRSDYIAIQAESKKLISTLLSFSSRFALTYRAQLDQTLEISARDRKNKADLNLFLLLIFSFLSIVFISTYVYRQTRHFRAINEWLQTQLTALGVAQVNLKKSGSLIEKLRLLDERKNIFISTINHELRTPLTSIIGYVSVLRENIDSSFSAQEKQILDVIDRNSTTLLNLIEEILTLSSLESGAQELEKEAIDVKTIIHDATLALTPEVDGSQSIFVIDIEENIDTIIYANRAAILQVFSNILSNSLKFSNGESLVRINVSQRIDKKSVSYIQIAITDQGIGIPESQLGEIFTSFYRASNAVSGGIPGTGLGLAITSRIVELHQGFINVVSKVGLGSTFTIELPSQVSAFEKMINERKGGVLERAILAIENCSVADLQGTCHEMIGALGFYHFGFLGDEIAVFSDWVKANNSEDIKELSLRRVELLGKLRLHSSAVNNLGVS